MTNDFEVGVRHEWGKLEEVIVGIGEGLVVPGYNDKVSFIYDPTFIQYMKKYGGQHVADIEPKTAEKVIEQINGFAALLEKKGVKVHRPPLLNGEQSQYLACVQKGQMQLYARDPILVIGNTVIETSIKIPMRIKEKFPLRKIIMEKMKETHARYLAVPSPDPEFGEDGISLEGGDVLLNGTEIYVGNSGRGSNKAGIAWLQECLGPEYTVHEIRIDPQFEHLDCVLALLRPGLGLSCSDAIGELPESLRRGWNYINVTIDQAKRLAANVMVLDETTAIIDTQHHDIGEVLKKAGHNVIETPYDVVATWGGAFRCSHHPLRRVSKSAK